MKPNKYFIFLARRFWFWTWAKLMNGFAPSDKDGNYKRPEGLFFEKKFVIQDKEKTNLYLLIGASCPWCHRTVLLHKLQNLSNIIKIIYLKPDIERGRWVFKNEFYGNQNLKEIYKKSTNEINFSLQSTLPVLINYENNIPKILSNESSGIISFMHSLKCQNKAKGLLIQKSNLKIKDLINTKINNGVYKCGFARNQEAYLKASRELFQGLEQVDKHLAISSGLWLTGKEISIADIYLFPTLIRWELIYSKLFKCTEKEISEFKNIMKWRLNFFHLKGIKQTCFEYEWLDDYYKALFPLNPNQIVPIQDSLNSIVKKNMN